MHSAELRIPHNSIEYGGLLVGIENTIQEHMGEIVQLDNKIIISHQNLSGLRKCVDLVLDLISNKKR